MDEKDLRSIIEQVLTEMNVSGAKPAEKAAAACACESAPEVEDGCIPDITEIDIRKQYLVKNPENGEEYAELKMNAPCRLGIGKAGARYNTLPQLEFRAAHSAAHPEAKIIKLSIGDVTRPLVPAVVEAMHKAVDEQGTYAGFHGYGPEQGYPFLREAIAQFDYQKRGY